MPSSSSNGIKWDASFYDIGLGKISCGICGLGGGLLDRRPSESPNINIDTKANIVNNFFIFIYSINTNL